MHGPDRAADARGARRGGARARPRAILPAAARGSACLVATLCAAALAAASPRARTATSSSLLLYDARGQTAFAQALAGGRLVRQDGCLYIVAGGVRTLLVLPTPQARWLERRGAVRIGHLEFRPGDMIRIGGGSGTLHGRLALEARRRGCDVRRVWWGSPEVARPRS